MASFYGGGGIVTGSSGTPGVGIANIEINTNRHLIVYLTDGTRKDLGRVQGATFTPILIDGILSWANDAGLENPESFDFNALLEDKGEMWFPVNETTNEDISGSDVKYWEQI